MNTKTNAMRILDKEKIQYNVITYDVQKGKVDGISVAQMIGRSPESVYKTLVAKSSAGNIYVFVIPVEAELDLKKAAKITGEKKIEMLPVKDLQKWTGYIRGGCSPIGMKKHYPTIIDSTALEHEHIIVSGGKIGVQMELSVKDLQQVTEAKLEDVTK
ncbi:MAG: Cys-tRNA(Pro) deacylase [Bacillaceae bacterium]|jgi:Cys-tRNA(Pro)/Cys-tRNA(Cys) deacylase|uniref:Cys-tRNA(Pro)/Cys-tRNA(Cys) deacylase n=1 Tax=Aeribacillus composti TaxID=1868734 RepID=A0ABY9WC71_9BACI|nr:MULTISPECIES: Cys-tRNA(Pro) deacylase [Aeribacillus]REJ16997.1 MAG: Cys-tRNA(Pro) deacylase [Bacillaceae bacterium]KZM55477.1 aminoacyl-tRNA deacylase [Aeribacillus pallidus]MDR9793264.1 Cys-tRNA(Pro) deacylase [Aeribacillus pallidus]MDR9797891.1 Cys-tRNA(Pro) deacylase [Aeribacillus pallidus]MED0649456.1 Cys-tRNA(Pro) deacylase [Aeribacillus composti]